MFAMSDFALVAQNEGGGAAVMVILVIQLAILIVVIAGMWKTFEKAGKPGWGAIIPIYNIVLLLEIAGKPIWWLILFFIPFVNAIVFILVALEIAKNFGQSVLFGIGLALLGFIFFPILGFGDAKYTPSASS